MKHKKLLFIALALVLCATAALAVTLLADRQRALETAQEAEEVPEDGLLALTAARAADGGLPIGPLGGPGREELAGQVLQYSNYAQIQPGPEHVTEETARANFALVLQTLFGLEPPQDLAATLCRDTTGQRGDCWRLDSENNGGPGAIGADVDALTGNVARLWTNHNFDPARKETGAQPTGGQEPADAGRVDEAPYLKAAQEIAEAWLLSDGRAAEYMVGAAQGTDGWAPSVAVDIVTDGPGYRLEFAGGDALPISLYRLSTSPDRASTVLAYYTIADQMLSEQEMSSQQAAQGMAPADSAVLIQTALDQIGKPYVLGGEGPDAFDGSGLVWYCLRANGLELERMSCAKLAECEALAGFARVDGLENVQPGDVLFFQMDSVNHAGICVGEGQMVDASSTTGKVAKRSYNTGYWERHFAFARRLAADAPAVEPPFTPMPAPAVEPPFSPVTAPAVEPAFTPVPAPAAEPEG